jgi:ABC-type Mn2+/Zn2+ transport system ATPase subunit
MNPVRDTPEPGADGDDRDEPALLRLDGVGRRYGLRGPWVLREVTLDVPPGSLVRVEGANGSGKSTLLRIVAGVDRPTAGRVLGRPDAATAYVPERFPPALPFPVLRYLTHLGAVRGLTAPTARERALHWLDRFGITGYARTPLDELSKGTCQKVALAQALLADPRLLVLDEAWTGLDAEARDTLDDAVRARVAAGATVLFVDHDQHRLAAETTLTHHVDAAHVRPREAVRATVVPQGAAGQVVIEAAGDGPAPAGAEVVGRGRVRVVAPAGESDGVLRGLLDADPPWHVTGVRSVGTVRRTGAAPAAPVLAPTPPRARASALVRYQLDLLLRSHRWLPPVLFYGAVMAIGVSAGQPLLGSLGYAAALLLPVSAWLVRVCTTNEPSAARACVASAVGAGRAQAGALAAAVIGSAVLGVAGTAVVAAVSGPHSDDMRSAVPVGPAVVAGLLAAAVSVLLGTGVGALANPPVVAAGGWSVLVTALGAGAVLLISGSPAQAAVTGLVKGSRTGAVHYPLLPAALSLVFAAVALHVSTRATPRRP